MWHVAPIESNDVSPVVRKGRIRSAFRGARDRSITTQRANMMSFDKVLDLPF